MVIEVAWSETPEGAEKIIESAHALRRKVTMDSAARKTHVAKWLAAEGRYRSHTVQTALTANKAEIDPQTIQDELNLLEALLAAELDMCSAQALLATAMVRRLNADQGRVTSYRIACKAAVASVRALVDTAGAYRDLGTKLHQLNAQKAQQIVAALKYATECRSEIGFWKWRFRR